MTVELHICFVTDINELMRRRRRQRMAVRREAWAELSSAIRASVAAAVGHAVRLPASLRFGAAAAG